MWRENCSFWQRTSQSHNAYPKMAAMLNMKESSTLLHSLPTKLINIFTSSWIPESINACDWTQSLKGFDKYQTPGHHSDYITCCCTYNLGGMYCKLMTFFCVPLKISVQWTLHHSKPSSLLPTISLTTKNNFM